ncbi:MAG TPA: nuclear transport factor 2 family protein [Dehalococcoidales bacterium]|nr:nuclear transport factor 2 family protein [Dehalococcoidales bacterium]
MSIEDLEKRVKAIEDTEEIKKLHHSYINLMDALEYVKVLDLFTDDCVVEVRKSGPKIGKKAIEDIYLGTLAKNRGAERHQGHFAVEPDITVEGNTAKGTWLVYMLFDRPNEWVQGKNEVEYRKENGKWKIARLKFTRTLASDPKMYP